MGDDRQPAHGARRNSARPGSPGRKCELDLIAKKLLEEAIERVRQLPEAVQDEAAEILLSLASKRAEPVHLDEGTRQAVREGKAQAGRREFASDEEMAGFFKHHGE